MNVQEVNLDISLKRGISPEVYLGQDDSNATTLVASIFDGATPFDLTGYTVRFCMRLPDGIHYYSVAGTTSGNVATFDIDETYAGAVHGTTDVAYVEISDGNDVIASTSRMCVIVLRGAQAGATPGEAYISEIEEAVERLDEVVEAAQEVLDDGIPLMTSTRRGGAKLGSGLGVDANGALNAEVTQTALDSAIQNLRSSILQAQTLLGAIGTVPVANGGTGATTAAGALTSLGAASQSDLDEAEQAIADNSAGIATLQESVAHISGSAAQLGLTLTPKNGYTISNTGGWRFGKVVCVMLTFKCSSAMAAGAIINPFTANAYPMAICGNNITGQVTSSYNGWARMLGSIDADASIDCCLIGILS